MGVSAEDGAQTPPQQVEANGDISAMPAPQDSRSAHTRDEQRRKRRERERRHAAQRKAEKDAAKQAAITEAIHRIVADAPPLDESIRERLADIIAATDYLRSYDDGA